MILDGHSAQAIATAAQALQNGELVGLPTETVYGLAADASNPDAVAKIFAAKGRPSDHPLIVHVADASGVPYFASEVPPFARQLIQAFWPGPLTLILPRRPEVGAQAAGGQASIGLRCPSHPVAHALLLAAHALGVHGVAAPSANQFGRVSPTTAEHVQGEFGVDLLILDGGACDLGIESTLIDCTRGAPVLLRPGSISRARVQQVCGIPLRSKDELLTLDAPAPRASGMLESHYAPKAKVRLMDATALQTALDLIGPNLGQDATVNDTPRAPAIAIYTRTHLRCATPLVLHQRMPTDAADAAQELFAVLRKLDDQGVQLIWIETPPDTPEWEGVRDRLQRAAA